MKQICLLSLAVLYLLGCKSKQTQEEITVVRTPVRLLADTLATPETVALYNKMDSQLNEGIMLGHQDDLAYGHSWYNEPGRSDVQEVTGRYPAVFGWEIGHLELGAEYNLDSIYFTNLKKYIYEANRMGGINTVSWHGDNILTGGSTWDCNPANRVVASILPGGQNHEKYLGWLDKLADFFLDLKDDNGELIPILFRMYHEHSGNWFWWGKEQCTPEEYKQLWVMTLKHFRDTRQVHNILYAYSPNAIEDEAEYPERYPGNQYVDIVGFDCYANGENEEADPEKIADQINDYKRRMATNLDILTAYAQKNGKIPAVTESGMERLPYPFFFSDAVYNTLIEYKVSYILFWRNAPDRPHHFYVPYRGGPGEEDFRTFALKHPIITLNSTK